MLSEVEAVEELDELIQSSFSTVLASDKVRPREDAMGELVPLKGDTFDELFRLFKPSLFLQAAPTAAPTLLAALLRRREVLRAEAVAQVFVLAAEVLLARPNAISQ